jgi:hypothetical protein
MLSPQELYESASVQPCEDVNDTLRGDGPNGKVTPWHSRRLVQFLKHVKYPCIGDTPDYALIKDTGLGKIGLPFKFLQSLDIEAFTESAATLKSTTSHSVRNACDIARSCKLTADDTKNLWFHRMGSEYLEHFGENSLPDCLMVAGPDLVPESVADVGRAPSTNETSDPGKYKGMACLPGDGFGVAGGIRSCMTPPGQTSGRPEPQCRSCGFCDENSPPDDPCCAGGLVRLNICCKAPMTTRLDFGYLMPVDEDTIGINIRPTKIIDFRDVDNFAVLKDLNTNSTTLTADRKNKIQEIIGASPAKITNGTGLAFKDNTTWIYIGYSNFATDKTDVSKYVAYSYKLRHIGLLERKLYGGYINLIDNSGSNHYAIMDDTLLEYFQGKNLWNYEENEYIDPIENNITDYILRARTISLLLYATASSGRSPVSDTQKMANEIKDLLWNGYGVILFSNVGFPNTRESSGLSYPDRISYNTYTIIGYDDTKLEFNECVYVLSCPWGKWINGGHPSWGPLPDGCFLVTESHLKCMLTYYPDREYLGCKNQGPCNPLFDDCQDPDVILELAGCGGHTEEYKCEPYRCNPQQRTMGYVMAVSLSEGFPKQELEHQKYYPVMRIKELMQEQTMYFQYD